MGRKASYSRATVTSSPVRSRTVPRKLTTAPHPGRRTLSVSAAWSIRSQVNCTMELAPAHRRDEGDLVHGGHREVVRGILVVDGQGAAGDQTGNCWKAIRECGPNPTDRCGAEIEIDHVGPGRLPDAGE